MSFREQTTVLNIADYPKTKHFAVLEFDSVSVSGYDPNTYDHQQISRYIVFENEAALKDYILKNRTSSFGQKKFVVMESTPVTIETEITIKIGR